MHNMTIYYPTNLNTIPANLNTVLALPPTTPKILSSTDARMPQPCEIHVTHSTKKRKYQRLNELELRGLRAKCKQLKRELADCHDPKKLIELLELQNKELKHCYQHKKDALQEKTKEHESVSADLQQIKISLSESQRQQQKQMKQIENFEKRFAEQEQFKHIYETSLKQAHNLLQDKDKQYAELESARAAFESGYETQCKENTKYKDLLINIQVSQQQYLQQMTKLFEQQN